MTDQRTQKIAGVLLLGLAWALPALADEALSDGDVIRVGSTEMTFSSPANASSS